MVCNNYRFSSTEKNGPESSGFSPVDVEQQQIVKYTLPPSHTTYRSQPNRMPPSVQHNSPKFKQTKKFVSSYQAYQTENPVVSVPPANSHDTWEIDMHIPDGLNALLKQENSRFRNITGKLGKIKPKWPVTSIRAAHKDADVFIGRANNPFGHSTKWKLR